MSYPHFDNYPSSPGSPGAEAPTGLNGAAGLNRAMSAKSLNLGELALGKVRDAVAAGLLQLVVLVQVLLSVLVVDVVIIELIGNSA